MHFFTAFINMQYDIYLPINMHGILHISLSLSVRMSVCLPVYFHTYLSFEPCELETCTFFEAAVSHHGALNPIGT